MAAQSYPQRSALRLNQETRWVYNERIEVWAHTRGEALARIRNHGFLITDPALLKPARGYHVVPISMDGEKRDGVPIKKR